MKFKDLLCFLGKRVEFRIDGTVLRRHLRYIAECNMSREQKCLLHVKRIQVLLSQEPSLHTLQDRDVGYGECATKRLVDIPRMVP